MKTLFTMILSGLLAASPTITSVKNSAYGTIDRVEESQWAVMEVCYNNEYLKMIDIPQSDFVTPKAEGDNVALNVTSGKFYTTLLANDCLGRTENLYQFRSDDNSVWWLLTEKEIGYKPDNNTEYTLIYYDNGTTTENKPCDCLPEWDCECEVYDDIFIGIIKDTTEI